MKITINNKEFSKAELLKLIRHNKIQAIIHIRAIVNLGLKEAKEIVDNLEENPDYYDNTMIKKTNTNFIETESVIVDLIKSTKEDVFKIGNEFLPKKKLLRLIKQSKLKAIKFLKDTLKLSLKESKEIVENLAVNPNYYKNDIIKIISSEIEEINTETRNKGELGSHFIREDNTNTKKFLVFTLVIIATILIYLSYK